MLNIQGLKYISDFLSKEEEAQLIMEIDQCLWLTDLKRRVQHYGYKYDYKKRKIDNSMKLGALPSWSDFVLKRFNETGVSNIDFDQLIINEYMPGQGIAPHIDCEPCFDNVIISLSLGCSTIMNFNKKDEFKIKISQILEARSIILMENDARYDWLHGITGRKTDPLTKDKFTRRISLTFRKVRI